MRFDTLDNENVAAGFNQLPRCHKRRLSLVLGVFNQSEIPAAQNTTTKEGKAMSNTAIPIGAKAEAGIRQYIADRRAQVDAEERSLMTALANYKSNPSAWHLEDEDDEEEAVEKLVRQGVNRETATNYVKSHRKA